MSKAGTFIINRAEGEILFAPLQPLMENLAQAEAFVLRCMHDVGGFSVRGISDGQILQQLRLTDETIRA
eukprot:3633400-Amphidinium_carterae.1